MKNRNSAEQLMLQLGKLSSTLTNQKESEKDYFEKPLEIMRKALGFDMSILYKVENLIENDLILEVERVADPARGRPDLLEGMKISIDINNPESKFMNEVSAFKHRDI